MSPAGSFESLAAAIRAGADSVYFGVGALNMRSNSSANFSLKDMKRIARICRRSHVKCYLALNTVLYDTELDIMRATVDAALEAGVGAVIAADIAAILHASGRGLPVHISVQANISNIEAVRFYASYADVMVLARELTLEQVNSICKAIEREEIRGPSGNPVRVELFAHGALCVSISGKCYMSLAQYNSSANRGACLQNCRRTYRVTDEISGEELLIDNKYVMSPRDLCTIGCIDRLIAAGVKVFKLEGRGRSPDYVHKVTRVYREAVQACADGAYTAERIAGWTRELESVFNRGFWHGGYYLGEQLGEWTGGAGNMASRTKRHLGVVTRFFNKIKVAELKLEAEDLSLGDTICVTGPSTGAEEFNVTELRVEGIECPRASKGSLVSIPTPVKLRPNDKVYLVRDRAFGENTPLVNA